MMQNRVRRGGRAGNQPRQNRKGPYSHQSAKERTQGRFKESDNETVYRIRIPRGVRYTERFILKALSGHVDSLLPILPKMMENDEFTFLVRDEDTAQALRSVNRRIRHGATGELLNVITHKTVAPWTKLKKEEKDAISQVLGKRADPQNRALDLSKFATHEVFTSVDLMMPLTKMNVFLSIVEQIESTYSNIVALSLKNNRIKYLEVAGMLPYFAKHLKVLDLSDNQIESMDELRRLKGLPLITLFLEGNPLCDKYTSASAYLSEVQAIFPRISRLDGNECTPRADAVDDEKEPVEPTAKGGFYGGDASLRSIVETFLSEYLNAYDGEDPIASRKNLIAAYDDCNSQFTMCLENLYEEGSGKSRWPNDNFSFYIRLSHNIKNVDRWSRNRQSRLFHGAMDVAAQLCKMPATRHLRDSFVIDVVLATPTLLVFSVQGLFEEAPFALAPASPQLNFFSRTFTVTPKQNGSVCVISDELYLTAMTSSRIDRYRTQLAKTSAADAAAAAVTATAEGMAALGAPTVSNVPSEERRNEMVAAFCQESGMLPQWSALCLMEVDWNYELAGRNFLAMKEKGSIPKEAFANQ